MPSQIDLTSLNTKFSGIDVFTQSMKAKDVVFISYVAVRGKDNEEGAVQRLLNKGRIKDIKQFILEGNMFFNTFILNWTNDQFLPVFMKGNISVPLISSAAQVLDGQHRLAGLEAAIEESPEVGEKEILVTMAIGLKTEQAAQIFININSEQKPVPKSLIYDLFGEIVGDTEHTINRAKDIVTELHTNEESPYYNAIKYPGKARGIGVVDLSTVVNSLKKHLEPNGSFATHNLRNLQYQKMVLLNYFTAIKSFYLTDNIWYNKAKNPFFTNAGFTGAIEFLFSTLLTKCAENKSFTVEDFRNHLKLNESGLLTRADLKAFEGKTQRKKIIEFLESNLKSSLPSQDEYKF